MRLPQELFAEALWLECNYYGIIRDGTNHYLYRVFKPDVSDTRKKNFLEKVLRGTVTRADITRITQRLGDKIAEVYGWKI